MNAKRCRTLLACIATLTALVMAGCAPVISPAVLKEVDQSVRFEQVLKNPLAYRGRTVLLGGDIIETQNFRFIVSVPGFLDPAIYRPRRKVTVVGSVLGKEVRPLGEIEYTYPIITKRELYIWPAEESSATQPRVRFGVGIGIGL